MNSEHRVWFGYWRWLGQKFDMVRYRIFFFFFSLLTPKRVRITFKMTMAFSNAVCLFLTDDDVGVLLKLKHRFVYTLNYTVYDTSAPWTSKDPVCRFTMSSSFFYIGISLHRRVFFLISIGAWPFYTTIGLWSLYTHFESRDRDNSVRNKLNARFRFYRIRSPFNLSDDTKDPIWKLVDFARS